MKIKTRTLTFNCQIDGPKDGIPVVFSNSLASNVEMWHPQCEALSGEYRVIRYDTRGHGKSEVSAPYAFPQLVEDVIALLDGGGMGTSLNLSNNRNVQVRDLF